MELRELSIVEVEKRIKDARTALGLTTCKRVPTSAITASHCPAVLIIEGEDNVVKKASRGNSIYPARRNLELVLEIITILGYDIKKLYRDVRSVVLQNPVVADNCFIEEIRTEGPSGYDLPDIQGMRFILSLTYTDSGN